MPPAFYFADLARLFRKRGRAPRVVLAILGNRYVLYQQEKTVDRHSSMVHHLA